MEVHKHPHHVTHKKKWTEFLLEFFMLFLAVFLGFVAENIREHQVEKHREKQYMKSMLEDLKKDQVGIEWAIKRRLQALTKSDSLISLLTTSSDSSGLIYYYARRVAGRADFRPTTGGFEQLKSAGGLRLIYPQVADSISTYYKVINIIQKLEELEDHQQEDIQEMFSELFDTKVFISMASRESYIITRPLGKPKLLSYDQKVINKFCMKLHFWQIKSTLIYRLFLFSLKPKGENLINLIQKKYHLQNE
ncbi:MAG TPA: hypothetical protein VMY77_08225 [Chitinophagaceae bacterium]|nr:hypothetical protein [Chitinophagaceae bacterium]